MTAMDSRAIVRLVLAASAVAAACAARALPPVTLETHLVVRIEALSLEDDRAKATGVTATAEAVPAKPVTVDLSVPWDPGKPMAVRLSMQVKDGSSLGATLVCSSISTLPGRPPVRAGREFPFVDEGTSLFEVYGEANRRLLLTLHVERVERPVVRPAPTPGAPVRFGIAVEGLAGETTALLETNEVRSFVGQSVEYSFQFGPENGREALRLVLLPVSIAGDMMTMDVTLSGVLPGPAGPSVVDKRDRVVVSRRATTFVQATAGAPPSGYRFQVTPDF
jgi:hypothetical protein